MSTVINNVSHATRRGFQTVVFCFKFYSFYLSEFVFVVWVFEIGSDYVALDGLELAIYTRLVFNLDLPASVSLSAGSEGEHHFI